MDNNQNQAEGLNNPQSPAIGDLKVPVPVQKPHRAVMFVLIAVIIILAAAAGLWYYTGRRALNVSTKVSPSVFSRQITDTAPPKDYPANLPGLQSAKLVANYNQTLPGNKDAVYFTRGYEIPLSPSDAYNFYLQYVEQNYGTVINKNKGTAKDGYLVLAKINNSMLEFLISPGSTPNSSQVMVIFGPMPDAATAKNYYHISN